MDATTKLMDRNCNCFDDDLQFFERSFQRTRPKPQTLTKVGDESFFKLTKKMSPTWEPRQSNGPEFFDPKYKASLCWYCYLNETDGEIGDLLKVRPMKLTLHLDDETFTLHEPHTQNSGLVQGRHFARQKVPYKSKRIGPDFLSWREVNIGQDLELFGRRYRIVACDEFTKNFLEDRGISVPRSEDVPTDAWSVFKHFRTQKLYRNDMDIAVDSRIIDEDQVPLWTEVPSTLTYSLAWLDSKNDFHNAKHKRTFRMVAVPEGDTVTMTETTPGFNNQVFLKDVRLTYLTRDRTSRHYRVLDLQPGTWIEVFKRPMYIYDCEGAQTKSFVRQQFGQISYGDCPMEVLQKGPPLEQIENLPAQLSFRCYNNEFPEVKFLLIYYINNKKIDVFEESHLRKWSKNRTFLLDIDASHLSVGMLKPGIKLNLFKWEFTLERPSDETELFIRQLEPVAEGTSENLVVQQYGRSF